MVEAFSSAHPGQEVDLVSIDMGYGHLRPAHALAEFLGGQPVLHADRPPLANEVEQGKWAQVREAYEMLSRASRLPVVGGSLNELLNGITSIPSLYPRRDLSGKTIPVRLLEELGKRGLGSGLAARLQKNDRALITTFFAPAVLSDYHSCDRVHCVVTDSDVNRVWAPFRPRDSNVTYFTPSTRARRRLKAYGVASDRISVTGFPLPHGLVGGPGVPILRKNLRRRLVTLDPRRRFLRDVREDVSHFLGPLEEAAKAPPHLVFAVGGSGVQGDLPRQFLPSLARRIRRGRLKVTLVAGIRPEVAEQFKQAIADAHLKNELGGGGVDILLAETHGEYFDRFNELLHQTDVLWTKPSEMSFFGALGIPLIFSKPVGSHERYNRRWAIDSGSGLKQYDAEHAGEWLWEMLKDGTLAGAAWTGYMRMPKFGLYRIVEEVLGHEALEECLRRSGLSDESSAASSLHAV